jgi:hypothetical protein
MGLAPDYGESTYKSSSGLQADEPSSPVATPDRSGGVLSPSPGEADGVISYLPEEQDDAQVTAGVVRNAGPGWSPRRVTSGTRPSARSFIEPTVRVHHGGADRLHQAPVPGRRAQGIRVNTVSPGRLDPR